MIWLWLVLVALRLVFYFEINLLTDTYLAALPDIILFLALMGVLLRHTVRYVKEDGPRPTAPAVIGFATLTVIWATPLPAAIGAHSRLLRKQAEFQQHITAIESMERSRIDLLPHVDPGPPLRVSFPCGLLGGHPAALVHDPSRQADAPEAGKWFRGTLHQARPVRGDWFLVTFKHAPPKKRPRPTGES